MKKVFMVSVLCGGCTPSLHASQALTSSLDLSSIVNYLKYRKLMTSAMMVNS